MITINNLFFSYENKTIINNLSLTINNNDFLVILGENGTGKSTLIKCLVGINKTNHNQIKIDDKCVTCYNDYHKFGYVPQVKSKISELPITAKEIFNIITTNKQKINDVCALLNINDILNTNINDLSGGQKQRINIAKSLLLNIEYLILDEPTTGLDQKSRNDLHTILKTLHENGVTIIIASHYFDELKDLVTCTLVMGTNSFERVTR